ncbi:MAG: hypothetical protein KAJ63_01270 [Methyloprofundus sp.]|nr:hypothetical protein [Methyloprofundus sp.]
MTGHPVIAEQLYDEAAEKLSAKEMRSFAWIELQKGLIDLQYERYEQALSHYHRANQAYSGYWLIEEHIAEVLNLLDRKQQAIALYNKIITKTGNPEFITALANILEIPDPELSSELQTQAESLYTRQFQLYPEAAIGHLVRHLLAKQHPGPKLLEYAKKNVQFRPNAEAKFLLVQSYLKFNQPDPAKKLLQDILETPWRTPQLLKIVATMENHGLILPSVLR